MHYKLLTDEMLVKLLKIDDHGAFEEIYKRYWRISFLKAYNRIKNKDAAKELIQNIFASLWEKRHASDICQLEAYLNVAVKYQVISYFKSTIKISEFSKDIRQTENAEADYLLNIHQLNAALQKAIDTLPEKTAKVFRLSRFEHTSIKEIAGSMGISEKAVEYHITRSLKILRVQLKDYFIPALVLLSCFQ